jgi:NitT/TauT family transport system substrate-binding protein
MTKGTRTKALSRRTILKTVGAVGLVATAGTLGSRVFAPAIAGPAPKVRLAWADVAACHSPLGFGVANGLYAKQNLDIELYPFTSNGQTVVQALATGTADAGAGLVGDWLKPLEQGFTKALPDVIPFGRRPAWADCVRHQEVRGSEGGRRIPGVL